MANVTPSGGASGSREKIFQPISSQVIWHNLLTSATKNKKWAVLISGRNNCQHVVSTRMAGCDRSLSRVSKGARENNCHGPRLALIRHCMCLLVLASQRPHDKRVWWHSQYSASGRGGRSIVTSVSVCPWAYLQNYTRPIFTNFLCTLPMGVARSVLLWRRCDTLCTSGFMDDVMFVNSGQELAIHVTQ